MVRDLKGYESDEELIRGKFVDDRKEEGKWESLNVDVVQKR